MVSTKQVLTSQRERGRDTENDERDLCVPGILRESPTQERINYTLSTIIFHKNPHHFSYIILKDNARLTPTWM